MIVAFLLSTPFIQGTASRLNSQSDGQTYRPGGASIGHPDTQELRVLWVRLEQWDPPVPQGQRDQPDCRVPLGPKVRS